MRHRSYFHKILFIVVLCFLISCFNNNIRDSITYDNEIRGAEVALSGSSCPEEIQIADSLIIIKDQCDSYFYHVYNKNTLKLLGKFGKHGRGPFEFLSPNMMNQYIKNDSSINVYKYDFSLNRVTLVNLNEAINQNDYSPIHLKIRHSDLAKISPINSAVVVADSFVVGNSANDLNNGRFFCYEISSGKLSFQPYYPEVNIAPHILNIKHLYTSTMALRPDGEYIASASRYFKRIDILDKKGLNQREIVFETDDVEPDFSTRDRIPPLKSHFYFNNICVSTNFVYAIDQDFDQNNTNFEEKYRIFNKRDSITLYVADWEGKNVERIKLIPMVLRIAVDEENKKLYGVNSLNNSLFVYELN